MGTKKELTRAQLRKKLLRKRRRIKILLVVLFVFLALFIAGIIFFFASGMAGKVSALYKDAEKLVSESTEDTFKTHQTSLIYDVDGNQIMSASGEKDVQYLEFDEIPQEVKDAFVDVEDKRFYKHKGFDMKAIARALQSIVKNSAITQGGSTITQQLSRNIFLSHEVSWQRKVEEIFISVKLEKKYSKEQILEFYINNVYFANGYYGIEAAAKGYFGRSVSDLSLSEIVYLCAIPNNPTLYDPLDNPDNTVKRRDRMLLEMLEENSITQAECDAAQAEEIVLSPSEMQKDNSVQTYVFYCATRSLMEASGFEFQYSFDSDKEKEAYDEEYQDMFTSCQKSLYTNGYRIYTSIDMSKQQLLQQAVDENLADFEEKTEEGVYEFQGAATCIDNETGYVVAIVGGRDQDLAGGSLNRAYQSYRQPGSAIKPLLVYTPVLTEEYGYHPDSIVDDYKEEDGPRNSNGSYDGEISLRYAVAVSKNTIAWKLFAELGPKNGLKYLEKMNFAKLSKEDRGLASALGGFTNGVSTVEMASGFATLENKGKFRNPTCIVKILDAEGETVLSNKSKSKRIYETDASLMMTSMLETVMSDGTGRRLKLENMPCAGKTGTTNGGKDGWFCGYTPYYTTAVWVGYDMPRELSELQGASYPGKIWKQFMEAIHEDLEWKEFEEYETPDWAEYEEPEETQTPEPTDTPEPTQTPEPEKTESPTQTPENEGSEDGNSQGGSTAAPTETPVTETVPPEPTPTEPPVEETDSPGDDEGMEWDEVQ